MTDRHSGYVVTLSHDMREDDAEAVINAIRMIKGVTAVEPVLGSHEERIAEQRRDEEWRAALYRLVSKGPTDE